MLLLVRSLQPTGCHWWPCQQKPWGRLSWSPERLDPGGAEPPGLRGLAQRVMRPNQTAAGQIGTSVHLQQPVPRKDVPHQAPDWTDQLDTLQGALLVNTPHMYDDVKAYLQEMLDIGAIWKSNSPWASMVILVQKKDGSLRFCIDLRKLNNWTVKDVYLLPLTACRDPSSSLHLTWSQGTGRSSWMMRASHWPHLL